VRGAEDDDQRPGRTAVPGADSLAAEGAFQALGQGLGEAYLGVFALFLGAGGFILGIIATLPTASTAAAQLATRRLAGRVGPVGLLLRRTWSAQAVAYAALGLALLAPYPWSLGLLCAVALVAWGLGGLAVPAWTALVTAVVPRDRLGWFFGRRGSAQQCGMLVAILSGGALLSWMTHRGLEALGFALVFALAGSVRLAGIGFLSRVPDPPRPLAGRRRAGGARALLKAGKVRRLALYLWALHLGTYVSTPFFVPYMKKTLGYPYALVGALVAVPAITKLLTLRFWGHVADRVGPGPVLRGAGWFVALVPLPWLFSGNPWWILLAQVYSGLAWGALELAQASTLLQTMRGRERLIALFNTVDGAVLVVGALLGGAFVNYFDARGMSGYLAAMAISAAARLVPAVMLLWRVREIGRPGWSHLALPLRVGGVRPTRGISLRPWGPIPSPASRRVARVRSNEDARSVPDTRSVPGAPSASAERDVAAIRPASAPEDAVAARSADARVP